MALELCKDCGRMHYSTDPCAKVLGDKITDKSILLETMPRYREDGSWIEYPGDAPTPAPVASPPKPKRNRNEYMRLYMANKRANKAANTKPVNISPNQPVS